MILQNAAIANLPAAELEKTECVSGTCLAALAGEAAARSGKVGCARDHLWAT